MQLPHQVPVAPLHGRGAPLGGEHLEGPVGGRLEGLALQRQDAQHLLLCLAVPAGEGHCGRLGGRLGGAQRRGLLLRRGRLQGRLRWARRHAPRRANMERFGALRVISHGFQASTARFRCLSLGSSSVRGRGLALQASQELLEVRLLHTVAEVDAVLGEKHLASSWSF